jgi:tRNA-2-methylthio-N6-dimethylallyladenosine synthase
MASRKRAYVETYGCQMNISDGELMSGHLAAQGYEIVSSPEEADVVLVNTCAIREHAEQRVLGRVAQLNGIREENPDLILGVTGCMAQRMGNDLVRKAPYVDLIMGPDGYRSLPAALEALKTEVGGGGAAPLEADPLSAIVPSPSGVPSHDPHGSGLIQLQAVPRKGGTSLAVLNLDPEENYEGLEINRSSGVSAWVSIQRGCDHRCTFCIVPYVRGPEKNRVPGAVLEEVRSVVEEGISEVTLLGQTVNSYRNGDWDFPRLLRAVARVEGIHRVRFTSPHPNDVTPELVEVMAGEAAVCEQLHLPFQAGNDRILKRMLRRHTVEEFREKVELVREAVPEIALSTDVIVAFPGETEAEFQDTLALCEEVRFDDAFTYRYSPRDGTPATRLPPEEFIPEEEGRARLDSLIQVTRRIQKEINEREVGRVEEVLVEKKGKEPGFMLGRTRRHKVVVFPGDESLMGTYRAVELTRTTGATFVGSLAEDFVREHS